MYLHSKNFVILISDSGGPLICNAQLAGIISAGPATCANGKPDIYTRLSTLNGNLFFFKTLQNTNFNFSLRLDK